MASEQEKRYYCKRCRESFPTAFDSNGREVIRNFRAELASKRLKEAKEGKGRESIEKLEKELRDAELEGFTGRKLTCNHAVSISELPVSFGSESRLGQVHLDPTELREINQSTTLEFVALKTDEQRELFIQSHIAQYQLHMQLAKKAKYQVQLLEDLIEKYAEKLPDADSRRKEFLQRFDYVFRKPEKKLEILAKDKERADRKVKKQDESKEAALARLRELMRKANIDPSQLK